MPTDDIEFRRTSGGVLGEFSGDVEQLDVVDETKRFLGSEGNDV